MKAYLLIFKTNILITLQYRVQALAGIFTQFAFGFMRVFVIIAFYSYSTETQPLSMSQSVSYIWMTQMLLTFMAWRPDAEVVQLVRDGSIAYEMIRPLRLSISWLMKSMAKRGIMPLMRGIPILLITILLPKPYNFELNISFLTITFGIISLFLAWILAAILNSSLNILTLYTISGDGLERLFPIVMMFFSGLIIPLPLFPDSMQTILTYSPFAGIIDTPSRVILQNFSNTQIVRATIFQILWILIFSVLNDFLMERRLKNAVVQGG